MICTDFDLESCYAGQNSYKHIQSTSSLRDRHAAGNILHASGNGASYRCTQERSYRSILRSCPLFMCKRSKSDKRSRSDDIIASDFVTGFAPQLNDTVEPLKTIRLKLNKQIFHLTKNRTIADADKFNPGRDGS